MTHPTLIVVSPSYRQAERIARQRALDPDCWVHAATSEIATRWIVRASQRGVAMARLSHQEPRPMSAARTVVLAARGFTR